MNGAEPVVCLRTNLGACVCAGILRGSGEASGAVLDGLHTLFLFVPNDGEEIAVVVAVVFGDRQDVTVVGLGTACGGVLHNG